MRVLQPRQALLAGAAARKNPATLRSGVDALVGLTLVDARPAGDAGGERAAAGPGDPGGAAVEGGCDPSSGSVPGTTPALLSSATTRV